MNFLGGATSLDSILKAYKTSETKGFFPYECFDHPDKMQNTDLSQNGAFYSKIRSCDPLEAEYTDYVNLLKSGLIGHRTSRRQIKTFKATTYWDRELSIPPTNMKAGTNALIQRLFALV